MPDTEAVLEGQLARALEAQLGPGAKVAHLTQLPGGASRETFSFDATTADGRIVPLILRRDFAGRPGPEGSMGLEARVLDAARAVGLAVPSVLMATDRPDLWGSAGLVMQRVPGETIARRILRDDEYSVARTRLAEQCGRFLAGLQSIDPASISGLTETDPLTSCRQAYAATGMVSPTFEHAFCWLDQARPAQPAGRVVVHGDFRLGNLIVGPDGVRAVIDWEGVHAGDPLEDLAWLCVKAWRFGARQPVAGVAPFEDLLNAYQRAGGVAVDEPSFRWWLVFGTLRWGVICMTQASVHLSGAVRSVELAAIGRRVCEQEWDLLNLLHADRVTSLERAPLGGAAQPDLQGRPNLPELLDAVSTFLRDELLPDLEGRKQFHARVALNVLAMATREVTSGPAQQAYYASELRDAALSGTDELASKASSPDLDDRLLRLISASVMMKLELANPGYI